MTATSPAPIRHLRPRGDGIEQPVTTVELFFDLVYVFAVTQTSHMILADLTVAEVGRAAFLLLIVWWAWIYTTWMANWFDPASPAVRAVLTGVMLVSLLMAAALPGAFGTDGILFAISYVVLQVGRNVAAASLLGRDHRLRDVFERLVGWSAASGLLWLAGAALPGDRRLLLWIPAVALDLCAPFVGYWLPGRGHAVTSNYDIDPGHFTDRCQGFIIIALGESIVLTGATAAHAGYDVHGRALPRDRVRGDRRAVVVVLLRGRRALAAGDGNLRGPRPARALTRTPTCTLRSWRGSSPWRSATTC